MIAVQRYILLARCVVNTFLYSNDLGQNIEKGFTMDNNTIEEQLQKIAETIKRIHDKLMNIPYSFDGRKEQWRRILNAAGRLYEAYVALKKKN